jgi:hypothetical protein
MYTSVTYNVIWSEYEKLATWIDDADEGSHVRHRGEFAEFFGADCRNHSTIIKVRGIKLVELTASCYTSTYN